jgi:hypothetical protein
MSAGKRKMRTAVVEVCNRCPRSGVVTRFAIATDARTEVMRIAMAGRAGSVGEQEPDGSHCCVFRMAIRTRNGGMCACERKTGFAMPRDGECGRFKPIDGMTRLTAVSKIGGELTVVGVLVARSATIKLRMIVRRQPLRFVTLSTRHG